MNIHKKNPSNLLARKCIAAALSQLLKEKSFSSITVSELTKKAGVSRMTYYRNYSSKEDIFEAYLEDALIFYDKDIQALPIKGNYYDVSNLTHYFTYVKKHHEFLDNLFKCGYGHFFLNAIDQYVMYRWKKEDDSLDHIYRLHAFSGALYNSYIHWSLGGARESPEEMAKALRLVFADT